MRVFICQDEGFLCCVKYSVVKSICVISEVFLLHATQDGTHEVQLLQKLRCHIAAATDSLKLLMNGGQLFLQSLVHAGIALHHHLPAQQPVGDVVLLGSAAEPGEDVDQGVLLGVTRNATVLLRQRLCRSRFFADITHPPCLSIHRPDGLPFHPAYQGKDGRTGK